MEWIYQGQKLLLLKNSPWFAFAFFGYSLLNSWHCTMMCGSIVFEKSRTKFHSALFWRMISYTTVGGIMGFFGQTLANSLELKVVTAFAFIALVALFISFTVPRLYQSWIGKVRSSFMLSKLQTYPGLRGFLLAAMPCHLLATSYAAAALSGSAIIGAFLLLGHAVLTTPALAFSWNRALTWTSRWKWQKQTLKAALIAIMALNLLYFGAKIFIGEGDIESRLLFCL